MMFRTQFGDLFLSLLPNLREVIFDRYTRWPVQFSQYWDVQGTTNPFENYTGVGPLGLPAKRNEGGNVQIDAVKQLDDKKLEPESYGLGVEHTREVLDDDKFSVFTRMGALLATAFRLNDEILAADVADNSHLTTQTFYQSADGNAIHSDDHPIDGGAATSSNELTTPADLSVTSLQSVTNLMADTVDDRGNQMMIIPNMLVVPTEEQYNAAQLTKSTDDPSTADRAISPFTDIAMGYSVWRYLTDADKWFLWSDYTKITEGWIWLVRQDFDVDHDVNVRNQTAVTVATKRFVYGVIDWRGSATSIGA
jgi:phage major head subunit gpT-like protein